MCKESSFNVQNSWESESRPFFNANAVLFFSFDRICQTRVLKIISRSHDCLKVSNKKGTYREIATMKKNEFHQNYQEKFEYHGNTAIERIRKRGRIVIARDWLLFNTVEEATEYFNSSCGI